MNNKPIFQSKSPLAFYVGLAISLFMLVYFLINIAFPDSLIYPSIIFILWFLTISRFSGRLIIYRDKVLIKYLGFWHTDKVILLFDKKQMRIRQSGWNFSNRYDSDLIRGHIFFDTIYLIDTMNKVDSIRINTRVGQLNQAIDIIENQIKNNR
jgi:hypothetical protein